MIRSLALWLLFNCLWLPTICIGTPFATKPNILLIMADDVGIEGFGCYGGTS